MSGHKIVYLSPGDMLEVRFVHPDLPKNAREWDAQVRPRKHLLRLWPGRVAISDIATAASVGRIEDWK